MSLIDLYAAGHDVKRWHTHNVLKEQNLANHSWGVALILMEIANGDHELLQAALVHDLHESESGDIPYPAKRRYPLIGGAVDAQEYDFNNKNFDFLNKLTPDQQHKLKWADMFELLLYAQREVNLGNKYMAKTVEVAQMVLHTMGAPNEYAKQLFNKVMK